VTKGQVNMLQALNYTIDNNICATVLLGDLNIQQRASTIIVFPNGHQFTTYIHVASRNYKCTR